MELHVSPPFLDSVVRPQELGGGPCSRCAVSPTHRPGTASARKGRMWPKRCGGGGWDHRRGRAEIRTPGERFSGTRTARRSPGWARPCCPVKVRCGAANEKAARWAAHQLDRRSRQIGIVNRQGAVVEASRAATQPPEPKADGSSQRRMMGCVIIESSFLFGREVEPHGQPAETQTAASPQAGFHGLVP